MKTYAPKGLHGAMLRDLLADLHATPAQAAKYLQVTERSVFRWLSDGSAPYAVLAALWHETPRGREAGALDVGNALVIERGLARATGAALAAETARLARLVAISETGAANDALVAGPWPLPAMPPGRIELVEQFATNPPRHLVTPSAPHAAQVPPESVANSQLLG